MRQLPPEPTPGDRVTAELIRNLIRCIRERTILRAPGYKVQTGPAGTFLAIDPVPRGTSAAPVDNGCWKIVPSTREEEGEGEGETVSTPVHVFANQYYLNGEVLVQLELDDAVEDFVCQGELGEGQQYTADDKPFVALKVPATTNTTNQPSLIGFKSLAELQTAQNDVAWVVKPLYKLTHDGAIAVDFRNCPALQVAEILA
jgi:hypothetical protein